MLQKTSLLFCLLIAALSITQFNHAVGQEQTIFLHLTAAEYQIALEHQWPMLYTLDYGSFYWVEVDPQAWRRLTTNSGSSIHLTPADFKLSLSNHSFDPLVQPMSATVAAAAQTADYHLVQFVGPTKQAWLKQLQTAGLEPVQYIHPFTYVVWGTEQALNQTQSRSAEWPFIRWRGAFAPQFRLQTISPTELLTTDEKPQPFKLLIYRQADDTNIQNEIKALGGAFAAGRPLNKQWRTAEVTLSVTQLPQAAAIAGIYSIQSAVYDGGSRGEFSNLINVGQHNEAFEPIPGYWDWLTKAGVTGREVIVATVDEGLLETHPDLISRVNPCVGTTCGDELHSLHGTHTAGIIAADGASNTKDQDGFIRGMGVAPRAELVEQIYLQPNNNLFDLQLLMQESAENGAVISSNSWGPNSTPQGYDMNTMTVDIGVRDANPAVEGHQSLTYVVAMMNGYGGTSTQGSPDEAKNIITVGSTKVRTSAGTPYSTANDLSINTAHGPALDGRHIPHIVAPGYYIDSLDNNGGYRYLFGTSMAAPQVSGAAALFVDYYRQQFTTDPSPAMVKAAILPVAHDLAGYQDADGSMLNHRFDNKQGWGRLNVAAVVSPTQSVAYYDNPIVFDETGESWQQSFIVADPNGAIRMMLVWTDAPGHGLGGTTPAWNNDLDLQVMVDDQLYYGNAFDDNGRSAPNGTADPMNNTEGVFLMADEIGKTFSVTILASNITSDGLPNQGDDTDQDFAFVCYNCLPFTLVTDVYLPLVAR